MSDVLGSVANAIHWLAAYDIANVYSTFLTPGGAFSVTSLVGNLCVALWFMSRRQRPTRTGVKLRVLLRAVFPRRLLTASTLADVYFVAFNVLFFGVMFGWMLSSSHSFNTMIHHALTAAFGTVPAGWMPDLPAAAITTVALYVAFEFGYFLNHYLAHEVPFLWELHKPHHTAESLSPITNFRVHPVYTIIFLNIAALCMGLTGGVLGWAFGKPAAPLTIFDMNAIMLVTLYLVDHLHHTHFWIPFTGALGRIFISPAHHQIHHSADPAHYNSNYGSTLAIFDWMAGTLIVPPKERQRLTFGVDDQSPAHHTIYGAFVTPVIECGRHLAAGAATAARTARQVVAHAFARFAASARPH